MNFQFVLGVPRVGPQKEVFKQTIAILVSLDLYHGSVNIKRK